MLSHSCKSVSHKIHVIGVNEWQPHALPSQGITCRINHPISTTHARDV